MSYHTDEIRKKIALIQTCCYHIDQLARQEHANILKLPGPTTDSNVTRLDQMGNVERLVKMIRNRCEEVEICLEVAEDMEKEASNAMSNGEVSTLQRSNQASSKVLL